MITDIEPIAGVIRVYRSGRSYQNGDPYEWAASVRWLSRDTIEILGVDRPPSIAVWRSIRAFLEDDSSGIRKVIIKRHGRNRVLNKRRKNGTEQQATE